MEYLKETGENWYPENRELEVKSDIAGSLHELFHNVGRKMGKIE